MLDYSLLIEKLNSQLQFMLVIFLPTAMISILLQN